MNCCEPIRSARGELQDILSGEQNQRVPSANMLTVLMTGLRLLQTQAKLIDASSRGMGAQAARRKIQSIVKRAPQIMVRISGGGKGIRHIKAHLDYIPRNGQIALEDQMGTSWRGGASSMPCAMRAIRSVSDRRQKQAQGGFQSGAVDAGGDQ
jgi:hypothetical protein